MSCSPRPIVDTAEYGRYLFDHLARPLLPEKFMPSIKTDVIGADLSDNNACVDNKTLVDINAELRGHSVEIVDKTLCAYLTGIHDWNESDCLIVKEQS